ncbi:hypothetical protein [Mycobacterium sp. shizuoka-1]|uniref:hypothetical protein n=1 Tax=Mycobacterium sp. shizuoka-1 TaxID=2039281 RepID=UPI000C062E44|nr:hypothetical protein [Mycobacterium sp. shizuoka-1]GAY15002.1 hypothetical protein MSZK_17280 [Mycobacterium sp. shizuoka-1]
MTSKPVPTGTWARRVSLGLGAASIATVFLAAPAAWADPTDPTDAAASATPVTPVDPAAPAPVGTDPTTAVAAAPAVVPHLSSPDNLPPGTSADAPPEGRLGYLRDLLHAMRTQQVSGSDALLLLTQRPLDAGAAPPQGVPAGPSGPVGSSAVPPGGEAPVPAPAG